MDTLEQALIYTHSLLQCLGIIGWHQREDALMSCLQPVPFPTRVSSLINCFRVYCLPRRFEIHQTDKVYI